MPLTDKAASSAKPREKPRRLFDGGGLYLEVLPAGGKYWRWKYRFAGKEKRLALGVYPEVSLKEARDGRDEVRRLLRQGIDPSEHRKLTQSARVQASENTFAAVAVEWLVSEKKRIAESSWKHTERRLTKDVFPWIGSRPISALTAPEILSVVRRAEARGVFETAHRVLAAIGKVLRYGSATGRSCRDLTPDIHDALVKTPKRHYPAITEPAQVGPLLVMLDGYSGTPVVRAALQLAPLTITRPGELRKTEWAELDLDAAERRIPGERMKMKEPFIVPLSQQAVAIYRELQPLTGRGKYVFPSERSPLRCMSDNAVNAALRRLEIPKEEMCGHGFRAMARTIMDEVLGFRPDFIEQQLAHTVKDPNGRAYNRTKHLEQRREMMQQWADYLDGLREKAVKMASNKQGESSASINTGP
jgi:integrase